MLLHKKSGESLQEDLRPADNQKFITRLNIPSVSVDEDPGVGSGQASPSPNFMHDPSNVLKHQKSEGLSVQVILPESSQLLVSSPPPSGSSGKRKVSLMPLVTEDDLRRSNMGHRDPISVAQVFGEDFASKFCVPTPSPAAMPAGPPAHSPLPYDCKEKMLRRRLSPEHTLLPFEIRDESVPEGVPTVKVRRKPMSLRLAKEGNPSLPGSPPVAAAAAATTNNNYEDVAVALSPVQLKFPSLPASMFGTPADGLLLPSLSNPSPSTTTQLDFGGLGVELDIAASHPDMVHFQQVLNDWIKKQSKVLGSAFLLVSSEHNTTYCQVCGNVLLDEPINFGDSNLLATLFHNYKAQQPESSGNAGEQATEMSGAVAPVLDLAKVVAEQDSQLSSKLKTLLHQLCPPPSPSATSPTASHIASLIGIRARCGFVAALVLAHSSTQARWEELSGILAHIPVLSTLMSIVANVEEQKRLAHQSQVFLSMTQNVFSSLPSSMPKPLSWSWSFFNRKEEKDAPGKSIFVGYCKFCNAHYTSNSG